MRTTILLCGLALSVSACSGAMSDKDVPKSNKDERKDAIGRLSGDDGIPLFGGHRSDEAATSGSPIGVNSFLWRATLDTLAFMPLASADPFGGVVLTDWYEDPKTPGERYKVNALILDRSLRADGVKLSVFKQKLEKGVWRDQPVDEQMTTTLEDTILTRARQLKVAQSR